MTVRRRTSYRADDRGTALVEFTFLAVLLLVPLIYVLTTVFLVQRAAFAVTEAARQAGRAYVTAETSEQGRVRADYASRLAMRDQGIEDGTAPSLDCGVADCLAPGTRVRVTVSYAVPLPLLSRLFGSTVPPTIPVTAEHVAVVDRFRGQR